MRYKALFLDIDGTTVLNRPDAIPSPRLVDAVSKAKNFVRVCFATSRPLFMAQPIFDQLQPNGLCAITDSTQIYDPVKKKIIETYYLNVDLIPKIFMIFKEHAVKEAVINDGRKDRTYIGGPVGRQLCSFCAADISPDVAESLIKDLSRISSIAVIKIPSYQKDRIWVTVANANATKQHAVGTIMKKLNLHQKELIGVGDGYNDFPLLMACGLKIAMGNAVPELKAIADFIAPSVDEDGVATVIEKFIL